MLFTPVAVEYRVQSSKRTGLVSTPSVLIDHQPIGALNEAGAEPPVSSEKSSTMAVADVCAETAKGKEKVAKAENEAAYKDTEKARYDAKVARAEADYAVAKEKCDDRKGNDKDVCVKEAKAAETKAKADAKATHVSADSRKDAAEDKRTADYKVAVEKCDSMSGDAKNQCVKDAKARYGKT